LIIMSSVIMLAIYGLASMRARIPRPVRLRADFVLAGFRLFHRTPANFGYLFLVLTLLVMENFAMRVTWPLWTLPLIFLAWVNTHGSFIIGIASSC